MKTAIPSSGNNIEAPMDLRFGRCAWFCIYDTESNHTQFTENKLMNASEGVGLQAAEFLAKQEVSEVYAMEVGPRAEKMMNKLNIKINLIKERLTIKQVINMLNQKN